MHIVTQICCYYNILLKFNPHLLAPPNEIGYHQTTSQINQGKGQRKEKGKGGGHLSKNYFTKSMCQLGRMKGFLSEGNVCSQIVDINSSNIF